MRYSFTLMGSYNCSREDGAREALPSHERTDSVRGRKKVFSCSAHASAQLGRHATLQTSTSSLHLLAQQHWGFEWLFSPQVMMQ